MAQGKKYEFTTVDGFDVTSDHSGKDSHGSQCFWHYMNGHFISSSVFHELSSSHRCYPHKFQGMARQQGNKYRWKCSVCQHETSSYETYSASQGHYDNSLACAPTYPSTNPVDRPENNGKALNSIKFVSERLNV